MSLPSVSAGSVPALDTRHFPASAQMALRLLARIQSGTLHVRWPDGQQSSHGHGEPQAQISLRDFEVIGAAFSKGDIGFAETYIDGHWDTDDLARLLAVFIANRDAVRHVIYGSWWGRLMYRLQHWRQRNTRSQARRNIAAHYDLGNTFYKLWLDPSMTYSSALFATPASSLQAAQEAKYARVLRELAIEGPGEVLEIGCGWGGFAEAAVRSGLSTKGLTLSTEQLAFAQERLAGVLQDLQSNNPEQVSSQLSSDQTPSPGGESVRLAGGGAAATVPTLPSARFALQDYRDEREQFDGIASIEMFEAVGEQYWPQYFETLYRCLKPGARAVIQVITIADELFEDYRRTPDFIQTYIFPGGMLPSPSAFRKQAENAGLKVVHALDFGQDYARTLHLWRQAFMRVLTEVRAQGFDERFQRMWVFYLAYCEAAFAGGNTDVYQFTLQKPR